MSSGRLSRPIDRTRTLCLACSSSLPPLKSPSPSTTSLSEKGLDENFLHITNCCQSVICPSCIKSNPRLARYDPCLACLGGVNAVASRTHPHAQVQKLPERNYNLDGAVRDEDTFILGDDDDDEDDKYSRERLLDGDEGVIVDPPPPYHTPSSSSSSSRTNETPSNCQTDNPLSGQITTSAPPVEQLLTRSSVDLPPDTTPEEREVASAAPYKYYINKADTLLGICLRFGVDSQEVCKLNTLPPSILRTTPHLLHTRSFLLLPANAKTAQLALSSADSEDADKVRQREENLAREHAEKRLQTLTKEVDWRVAKAYVALADDVDEQEARSFKRKELGPSTAGAGPLAAGDGSSSRHLESMAIERYLDDDEWEATERRAGRVPEARPLPLSPLSANSPNNLPATSVLRNLSGGDNYKGWWSKLG